MASIVGIANRAIQKVGAKRILALTDNSREARAINACYDSVRSALLRRYRWKFAKKRAIVAADAATPAFDFAYQFTLPADCLRVILQPGDTDWHVEGRKVLTRYDSVLQLNYIANVVDPNLFDAQFAELFSLKLAIEICDELTDTVTRKKNLQDEWKEAYAEASQSDSFEDPPIDAPDGTWITARHDGFYFGSRFLSRVPTSPYAPTITATAPPRSTYFAGDYALSDYAL